MTSHPWMSSFDFDDFNAQHRLEVMDAVLDGLYDYISSRVVNSVGIYTAARSASKRVVNAAWILFPGSKEKVRCR